MNTGQLIEKLKELDPEGKCIIRVGCWETSGCITYVDSLPGYYDGGYYFYDASGNYVYSKFGNKIIMYVDSLEEFICDKICQNSKITFEELMTSIKYESRPGIYGKDSHLEEMAREAYEKVLKELDE